MCRDWDRAEATVSPPAVLVLRQALPELDTKPSLTGLTPEMKSSGIDDVVLAPPPPT
jgi:hypothetical protein